MGFVAVAPVAMVTTSARAQDPDRVDQVSKSSFANTLKKVDSALKEEHMMIVARVDHKNMLLMVGANIKGASKKSCGAA